jgi:hypothetical protein
MMKIIVAVVLFVVAVMLRPRTGSFTRRYLGFVLVSIGALLWAGGFDTVQGKDVVSNAAIYRRVLLLSGLGVIASVAGSIAALWCRDKPLKAATMLVGVASAILCAADIVIPY